MTSNKGFCELSFEETEQIDGGSSIAWFAVGGIICVYYLEKAFETDTQTEIGDYTKFMSHYYNDTIADQLVRLNENIEEVMGMDFPNQIPVLKLVSSETAKGKQTGDAYQNAHIERLGTSAQWRIMEGNHYLYHGHEEDIYRATNDFLYNK